MQLRELLPSGLIMMNYHLTARKNTDYACATHHHVSVIDLVNSGKLERVFFSYEFDVWNYTILGLLHYFAGS